MHAVAQRSRAVVRSQPQPQRRPGPRGPPAARRSARQPGDRTRTASRAAQPDGGRERGQRRPVRADQDPVSWHPGQAGKLRCGEQPRAGDDQRDAAAARLGRRRFGRRRAWSPGPRWCRAWPGCRPARESRRAGACRVGVAGDHGDRVQQGDDDPAEQDHGDERERSAPPAPQVGRARREGLRRRCGRRGRARRRGMGAATGQRGRPATRGAVMFTTRRRGARRGGVGSRRPAMALRARPRAGPGRADPGVEIAQPLIACGGARPRSVPHVVEQPRRVAEPGGMVRQQRGWPRPRARLPSGLPGPGSTPRSSRSTAIARTDSTIAAVKSPAAAWRSAFWR